MAPAAILNCQIHKISLANGGRMAQTHHLTKFHQNWSFHCRDVAIFRIFKMTTAAILDFWNRKILLAIWVARVETHQHANFFSKSVNQSQIYYDSSISQDGGRRHIATMLDCRIHKIILAVGVWRAHMQQCTKFRQNRSLRCRDIVNFRIFKLAAATIFDFWNREILLAIVVEHQQAKFRQNRSIGCEDIKIFRFFKMAAAAILDFRNREFLFAVGIWRAQAHHYTKFRQNRSFRYGDTAIFRIFKAAILDFWNREILLAIGVQRVETHQHVKFCQNWPIGCEDIKIFRFFKMAAVHHLGFVWDIFGQPTVSIWGSLSLCKIWLWWCSSFFIIWTFQYLARFAGWPILTKLW